MQCMRLGVGCVGSIDYLAATVNLNEQFVKHTNRLL